MSDCVFCKILSGEFASSMVYRDDMCSAFLDIQPVNPGHLLVIPNKHVPYLADLDPNTGAHLFRVGQRLAAVLRASSLDCEGVNFFLADGEAAMQEVFHVHLHVFPRFDGDGFGLTFGPNYYNMPDRSELDRIAAHLREKLKQ